MLLRLIRAVQLLATRAVLLRLLRLALTPTLVLRPVHRLVLPRSAAVDCWASSRSTAAAAAPRTTAVHRLLAAVLRPPLIRAVLLRLNRAVPLLAVLAANLNGKGLMATSTA